jgi:hypothetical protein
MRKVAAVLAGILLAGGFAACGGDGDSADPVNTGGTTAAGNTTDDPSDTDTAFSKLLEEASSIRIKVTYESGGQEFTIAQDGEGRQAYSDGNAVVITSDGGDHAISCDSVEAGATCTELTGQQARAAAFPFTSTLLAAKTTIESAGRVSGFGDESTEDIAGRSARCVTIRVGNAFTACADEETGVLLKWETSGTSESSVIATEVTEPTDADFEAPAGATVQTPPSLPDLTLPNG